MRWQMALYKETSGKAEDADAPEKVVKRVQEVSAVLYHIELVRPVHRHTNSYTNTYSYKHSPLLSPFLFQTDRASFQIQEDGLAQASVQTASQGGGGLLQDDATL